MMVLSADSFEELNSKNNKMIAKKRRKIAFTLRQHIEKSTLRSRKKLFPISELNLLVYIKQTKQ